MKSRNAKLTTTDVWTMALGRIVGVGALLALLVGLPLCGLWALAGNFDYGALRWIAASLALGLIPAFIGGCYVGRLEARGFLGGMDAAIDKLSQAVNLRDTSRITVHRETRHTPEKAQPNYNVFLPQEITPMLGRNSLPTITNRQLTEGEVVEL